MDGVLEQWQKTYTSSWSTWSRTKRPM